jgi:hypothetical protein
MVRRDIRRCGHVGVGMFVGGIMSVGVALWYQESKWFVIFLLLAGAGIELLAIPPALYLSVYHHAFHHDDNGLSLRTINEPEKKYFLL